MWAMRSRRSRRALLALALPLALAVGAPAQRPAPRPSPVWSAAFSPDGAQLALGGYRKVTLWSVADGTRTAEWAATDDAVRALAFSPDGALLAVGGGVPGGGGALVLLDAKTGRPVRAVAAHEDTVEALAFAGPILISAGDDERVVLTDTRTGQKVGALTEHVGRCLSVAVPIRTSDGSGGAIFATGGADKMLKIWDADLRRVVVNFDQSGGPVWCVAPTPQPGRFAAACGDGAVRLFQVRADRPGAEGDDADAARRPESAPQIAPAARKGEPAPRTGSLVATLQGHDGPVYAVAVSRNGNHIVSGGADRKVVVWNRDGGRIREHAEAGADIWGLAISPNSRWLAAVSRDGRARVYDLTDGTLVRTIPTQKKAGTP